MKPRPKEKEKTKVPSLLGRAPSITLRTRNGDATAMRMSIGTLRGHGLASATLLMIGGIRRSGVTSTILGTVGMSDD